MWIEPDTDGDAELARQLQQEEEQKHASNTRADAAAAAGAMVPYRSAAAAASSSSSHAATLTRSSELSPDSPSIQILQRQVAELLSEGCGATVDIRALFQLYNAALFDSALDAVHVEWSSRMKLCAGVCSFQPQAQYCRIGLSSALLQYRPISDVVETLLHESIHALLFLGPERCTDRDAHGPQFLAHMHRINKLLRTRITVYHTFEDEVDLYRTHVWKCDGACVSRAPFFGLVKRSSNRAPGPNDTWWERHALECGGSFTKIASPAPSKEEVAKEKRREEREKKERMQRKMDAFVTADDAASAKPAASSQSTAAASKGTPAVPASSSRKSRAVVAASSSAAAASHSKSSGANSIIKSGGSMVGSKRKGPADGSASADSASSASTAASTPITAPTLAPIFRASPRKPPKAASSAAVTSSAASATAAASSSSSAAAHTSPIVLVDDDLVDLTRDDSPAAAAAVPVPVLKKPRVDSAASGLNPAFTLIRAGSVAAAVAPAPVAAAASSAPSASAASSTSDLPRDRRAERARAVDLLAARAGRASPSVLAAPVAAL